MTNFTLWLSRDCNHGPWPVYLDCSREVEGGLFHIRQYVGAYHSTDEPSALYLRSLRMQARIKLECQIAMEFTHVL